MIIKRVGILYHPQRERAIAYADELERFLASRIPSVWKCSSWEEKKARGQLHGTDMVVSVGGDGTILHTARAVAPDPVPILGINLGRLGFLTELSAAEALDKLPLFLSGAGWVEQRAMIETELPSRVKPSRVIALNDVVLVRGSSARLIQVEVTLDGAFLTRYRADGVILATATGSTGYCLAAGGPILHPETKDIVLKPIAPHFSLDQALVLPASTHVRLKVTTIHSAMVSIDGQVEIPLQSGDEITARLSPHCAHLLRARPRTYFYNSLEEILKGKTL